MNVYPIFLVGLDRRRCFVVGGDAEAERKVQALLERDADVTLIAATPTAGLERLSRDGRLRLLRREFEPGDLADAFLVIATPDCDAETRDAVFQEAEAGRVLVNTMDHVSHCSFVAGSVVRRGALQVAISTSGAAPALAVRLRERLERELGQEYAVLLEWLETLRPEMARHYPVWDERRAAWYRIVDSDVIDLLRAGQREAARHRLEELVTASPLA